ncbi:MAG TPA: DNA gyrase inhibitor YacG [Rhodobacteraceae bacterium]|nr:DNA gyrase inhibitor YacG [Paracoccaceae bacterium]
MACPICNKPTETAYRTFCCKRCADIDLARWMQGRYAVPSAAEPDLSEIDAALEAAVLAAEEAAKKSH